MLDQFLIRIDASFHEFRVFHFASLAIHMLSVLVHDELVQVDFGDSA